MTQHMTFQVVTSGEVFVTDVTCFHALALYRLVRIRMLWFSKPFLWLILEKKEEVVLLNMLNMVKELYLHRYVCT